MEGEEKEFVRVDKYIYTYMYTCMLTISKTGANIFVILTRLSVYL